MHGSGAGSPERSNRINVQGELIMTSLSRTAQAKLAEEIAANRPAPEWDSVPELSPRKWKEPVALKDGEKRLNFGEMAELSLKLKGEIEYREKVRKQIQLHLEAAMLIADLKEVMYEGHPVQYITRQGSRKLSDKKLMENGVTPDQIAASYEIGDPVSFVQIGKPKRD